MLTFHIDGLIYGMQPHGGISRVFTNLINALSVRKDCRVVLYLPGNLVTRLTLPKYDFSVVYPAPKPYRPGKIFHRWNESRSQRALEQMWSGAKAGVFLSSHYSTHAGISIPQIQVIQDLIYERLPEMFSTSKDCSHAADKRNCVRAASGVIAPSRWSMQDSVSLYELSGKKSCIIPYAIDDRFRITPTQESISAFRTMHALDQPFILHSGSRYLHKNFSALMAAFSRWDKRKQYRLVNVGGGSIQPHEAALAKGLGIESRVKFIGGLSDEELVTAYHAASAFVFPSLYEGFGLPVIEAIACGLPAAVSNASCLPEVGGDTPWYFDPTNGDQLLEALDQALSEPANSPRLRDGRDRLFCYSWDDVASQFVSFASDVEEFATC